jgi:hypothetical protein
MELCSRAADWAAQAPSVHVSVAVAVAAGRKMESHIHIARKRFFRGQDEIWVETPAITKRLNRAEDA